MSNTESYNVRAERLANFDYKLLIMEIPLEEIEDILAVFVSEQGRISKDLYYEFLINTCLVNLNALSKFISRTLMVKNVDLIALKLEIVERILKYNPYLDPKNIYINNHHVLKIIEDNNFEGVKLDTTEFWDMASNTLVSGVPATNLNESERTIDDLEWEKKPVFYARFNEYIDIKKFNPEDSHIVLSQYYPSENTFKTMIVTLCVIDSEELYDRLHNSGVNIDPIKIVKELYELCVSVNSDFTYDNARIINAISNESMEASACSESCGKGSSSEESFFKNVTKQDLLDLNKNIRSQIIGQDEAISVLTEAIKRASIGLKDPNKPIGSFMFTGRTGIGKTETCKVLAKYLTSSANNIVTIDCSEYTKDHEYSKLIGSPPGYHGHDEGGVLTNAIKEHPFSVVVFDEVEKAHRKIHEIMLQILDEGRLTDGKGNTVSFKDTIIIMTSNVGVSEMNSVSGTIGFGDVAVLTEQRKNSALDSALKKAFKPEFLNRIDNIIYFRDLSETDYLNIIALELSKLNSNLATNDTEYKHIVIKFNPKIHKFIYTKGITANYGARPLKRAIEKYISTSVANFLLKSESSEIESLYVYLKKEVIAITATKKSVEVTPASV